MGDISTKSLRTCTNTPWFSFTQIHWCKQPCQESWRRWLISTWQVWSLNYRPLHATHSRSLVVSGDWSLLKLTQLCTWWLTLTSMNSKIYPATSSFVRNFSMKNVASYSHLLASSQRMALGLSFAQVSHWLMSLHQELLNSANLIINEPKVYQLIVTLIPNV